MVHSNGIVFDDNKNIVSSWSTTERPSTESSHSQAWSHPTQHSSPYMIHQSVSHSHQDPISPNEWNTLFSAPLNPSVFATLAANGVFPVPRADPHFRAPPSSFHPSSWSHASTSHLPRITTAVNDHHPSRSPHAHDSRQPNASRISVSLTRSVRSPQSSYHILEQRTRQFIKTSRSRCHNFILPLCNKFSHFRQSS